MGDRLKYQCDKVEYAGVLMDNDSALKESSIPVSFVIFIHTQKQLKRV